MKEALQPINQAKDNEEEPLELENSIPEHHGKIWARISKDGSKGRTYFIAKCCVTIFDRRRQTTTSTSSADNEREFTHPSDMTEPLTQFLGKRSAWKECQLSKKLKGLEENVSETHQATYNIAHNEGQLLISVEKLRKELGKIRIEFDEYRSQSIVRSQELETQLEALARKTEVLQVDCNVAEERRQRLQRISQGLLSTRERLCDPCQRMFLVFNTVEDVKDAPK